MRILVLIPTYNERENLPVLAAQVLDIPGTRILVLDDGSPDGTGAIADALAAGSSGRLQVLHRRGPRGLGRSYLEGFRLALASDADVICQMDADLSHDPAHLPDMVAATANADLVVGSRYVPGGRVVNWPWRRVALSGLANAYVRQVTGIPLRDCTSGYRCWRRDALARLPLDRVTSEGYAFLVEVAFLASTSGLSVMEAPIVFVERRAGASKLSLHVIRESVLTPWRLRRAHRSTAPQGA
jgi:dolichol-phosphate mannosyltransferase